MKTRGERVRGKSGDSEDRHAFRELPCRAGEKPGSRGGDVGSEKQISRLYIVQVDPVERERLRSSNRRGQWLEQCLGEDGGKGPLNHPHQPRR